MKLAQRLAFTVLSLPTLASPVRAQWADYAHLDRSTSATSAVLVKAIGDPRAEKPPALLSASYARWSTGESAAVGYTLRAGLGGDRHRWIAGGGPGIHAFHRRGTGEDGNRTAASLRVQSEWFGPAPAGSYYALVQAWSFRRGWLVTAQYSPAARPVGMEWTRYHERDYQATSLGVRFAPGPARWFLRLGGTRAQGETRPYVGVAFNAF